MAGVYFLLAPCFACKRLFASNPNLVPSLHNEPICKDCIDRANVERREKGLALWTYAPGAYGSADEVG